MPEGFAYLNMFAVDLEKGASFRWIMLPALNPNNNSNPDDNNAQGDMEVANSRINRFSDWLSSNGSRMKEKKIQERQKAVDALKSATKGSTRVDMEDYVHGYNTTVDISHYWNSFQLSFWVYAFHEFKTQADWFYVRQEANLNAGWSYHPGIALWKLPQISFEYEEKGWYVGKYEMDNYLINISSEIQNRYAQVFMTSPKDTNTGWVIEIETETGMDWEFTGGVGFEGINPTGNVGLKIDVKKKSEFSIQDCQVYNKSGYSGVRNAKWLYQFKEVSPIVYFAYLAFTDPSPLQRGIFSPQDHWLWRFEPQMRNIPEGKNLCNPTNI